MSRCAAGVLVAAAALGAAAAWPAGVRAQQVPVFRSGVRTVMVPAAVTDEYGETVRDLTQDDFEIRDNGVVQPITFFDRTLQPITAILLVDGSASLLTLLEEQIGAANEFILRLLPGDRLRIGSFAEDVRLMPDYSGDRDALLGFLENEFNIRVGRRTRLWDAMDQAITALAAERTGRRVLIVISDGLDTWSMRSYDDVRRRAGRNDVAITFARVRLDDLTGQQIEMRPGPNGSSPGRMRPLPRNAFETLTAETGGMLVRLNPLAQMDAPFTQIALDLHGQYLLGFTPSSLDGKTHGLDVRVTRRGVSVRARKSYVASLDGK